MKSSHKETPPTVADYIAIFLRDKGVSSVFELSGGMIAFLTDAIHRLGATSITNVRHEQAAGFAAEGATRVLGIPSVALATSGPGATNLITAIGSAYFDSTPVLFLTGQVNQRDLKLSPLQRQNGFQELDIVSTVKGITKYCIQVHSGEELIFELSKAWAIAQTDRPGPVLIDIPIDVQQMHLAIEIPRGAQTQVPKPGISSAEIENAMATLATAKRPLILAGGGIRAAGSVELFREFVKNSKIPVVHSLMGVDSLDSNSPYRKGMIGSYGNRWANKAIAKSDVVLVLGSRLDVRQTGNSVEKFHRGKTIIRVDIDPEELQGRVRADIDLECSLKDFLGRPELRVLQVDGSDFLSEIEMWEREHPASKEQPSSLKLSPDFLMKHLSQTFKSSQGYVVDVGQHQMWAAQSLLLQGEQRFLTSGGMGSMGFAIPASIGASTVKKGRWVVIVGDGCAQLAIAELQTIKHYNLPIAICIINNGQHGMVAQFQEENMDSRFVSTRAGYSTPDFLTVGEAFGIPSIRVDANENLAEIDEFVADRVDGPLLVEIVVSNEAKALPKLSRHDSLSDL